MTKLVLTQDKIDGRIWYLLSVLLADEFLLGLILFRLKDWRRF